MSLFSSQPVNITETADIGDARILRSWTSLRSRTRASGRGIVWARYKNETVTIRASDHYAQKVILRNTVVDLQHTFVVPES